VALVPRNSASGDSPDPFIVQRGWVANWRGEE
jgi:hypothetical protein